MSPDGLSYAYLGDTQARKFIRYDIASGQSVTLWNAAAQIRKGEARSDLGRSVIQVIFECDVRNCNRPAVEQG